MSAPLFPPAAPVPLTDAHSQVRSAFASIPKPQVIAPHLCPECEDLSRALAPFTGESLPDDVFARHVWDLPLLSDEAKHYYLPAWLLRAGSPDSLGGSACDALLYALESDHRWRPQPPYTQEQWLAIDAVLVHVAACDPCTTETAERIRKCIPR